MALGPRGLFETLEDGATIYYGKMGWNAPGDIVDEAAMSAIWNLNLKAIEAIILTALLLVAVGQFAMGVGVAAPIIVIVFGKIK